MPRGGARVNSGPPPDPNALRRDRKSDQDGWTDLPAGGFEGETPVFPLCGVESGLGDRESELWASIWRTPQAAAWSRLGWTLEVGLYVRLMVLAEGGDVKAASELRQWSDRLGLNPAAMMRNRWRVVRDQVGERRAASASAGRDAAGSMKDRLKALDGGGA
jgi:hypothetical protein